MLFSTGSRDRVPRELAKLQAELGRLRTRIERTGGQAASGGRARLRQAGTDASEHLGDLLDDSEKMLDDLKRELRVIEEQAGDMVRARPFQAVLVALGLGFLLALLFRR